MSLIDEHPSIMTALPSATAVYVAPRMVLTSCPRDLNTFDGFEVHGLAYGSDVEDLVVEVSVAGVVRTGRVTDGAWSVRFESGALPRWQSTGLRPVTARITDRCFNTAQVTEWVTVEEFVDGFVHIDDRTAVVGAENKRHLLVTGEIGVGTHEEGRELVVVLVRDDVEAVVVSTAFVEPGWDQGEWRARLPLDGVTAGTYRVRAILTDKVCPSLTRTTTGRPVHLDGNRAAGGCKDSAGQGSVLDPSTAPRR